MAKTREFNIETPKAKNNRMNWSPKDFPATEILDVDVRMSSAESKHGSRPYVVLTLKDQATIAVMAEQLLADTGDKVIISREGRDIEIDLGVEIGVKDGKFFATV